MARKRSGCFFNLALFCPAIASSEAGGHKGKRCCGYVGASLTGGSPVGSGCLPGGPLEQGGKGSDAVEADGQACCARIRAGSQKGLCPGESDRCEVLTWRLVVDGLEKAKKMIGREAGRAGNRGQGRGGIKVPLHILAGGDKATVPVCFDRYFRGLLHAVAKVDEPGRTAYSSSRPASRTFSLVNWFFTYSLKKEPADPSHSM
ncbi:MAG: hypothetical protein JWP27_625 [Flaviaesturariibacter sp.]|nr:hypothetical protein [Flaviaesturariibacter sp.]